MAYVDEWNNNDNNNNNNNNGLKHDISVFPYGAQSLDR